MTILTRAVARLVAPSALAVAVAILLKGYHDTGDGFSAGVVAATAVLLLYVALGVEEAERALPVRHSAVAVVVGLLLALVVAFVPAALGQAPLTHHPRPGVAVVSLGSVELHTALLFDVGVFLVVVGFAVTAVRTLAHMPAGARR